jgi:dTDP-glucose 4,6-dehydratase
MRKVLVTGGAGFIGSELIKTLLEYDKDCFIVNIDSLTYAGDKARLTELKEHPRYIFFNGDIRYKKDIEYAMTNHGTCKEVINLAAESHVDRSISNSKIFMETNVLGTHNLLEVSKSLSVKKFIQVSTDEVYGSIRKGEFNEMDKLNPSSPYSASKAAGDLLALSYHKTFGLPVIVTRGANTFGAYQYPEKLIPLFISNAMHDQSLPVYGDGKQVRNWIHVKDHVNGIICALDNGKPGDIYNISSSTYLTNLSLINKILKIMNKPKTLIKHVKDRLGHDIRYAINSKKLRNLGWEEKFQLERSLTSVVIWYVNNDEWLNRMKRR